MTEDKQFEMVLATRAVIDWPESVLIKIDENSYPPWTIENWLTENIGKNRIDWTIDHTRLGLKYKFKNPDHKTLFAITWL